VRVDTRSVAARKMAGIRAHATQRGEWERIPKPLRWIHLDDECFVQAWPPRPKVVDVEHDLFAGV
jgi:hypothetical protein